ncbi:homeodomain-interacting protein kinase 1-like [Neolamprologus brichardi]|uniref:Homeodomain-interacting protein kinase 1-like n=1 Tax=Neolamprologus brichardi TaxID=32507 RepID=A0A3Q4MLH7_NEOBR|nr:homeodomain-interacting protein kinase 1-like [Neolamprologus brichardi]
MNALIESKTCKYMVKRLLGEGSFGRVVQCVKLDTFETVAVKVAKRECNRMAWKEATAVKKISALDKDRCNLVKYYEVFEYKYCAFISMEMLDISLHDFMNQRYCNPLSLNEIRVILKQMFVALTALKSIGIMHADIKPDNIILVNQSQQPFKVKLIDFGCANHPADIPCGAIIQALGYRAPEVMLGIPVTESADMWALGSVAAFLYLGYHFFPSKCEYEMMRGFVHMLGQPNERILEKGKHSNKYFWKRKGIMKHTWVMKTPVQYSVSTGIVIKQGKSIKDKFTCMEDLAKHHSQPNTESEVKDTLAFLSLLKWMLCMDPVKRITPVEGLGHRFITMKHLPEDPAVDCYVESSRMSMKVCPPLSLENEIESFVTSSEIIKNREQSSKGSRLSYSFATAADIQRNRQKREAARTKNQTAFRLAWHAKDDMSWKLRVKQKPGMTQKQLVESFSKSSDSRMECTSSCSCTSTSTDSGEGSVNAEPPKGRTSLGKRIKNFFLRLFRSSSDIEETQHQPSPAGHGR